MTNKNQKKITEVYNSSAKFYSDKCYNELDYKPLDRQLLDRFSQYIPLNEIVCDIGCGPGEIANYLYNKNLNVIGIDISEKMINEAKRLNPNIEFKIDNMFNLNMSNDYLFGICSFYAIVNFQYKDIKKIIKEYYRVIKRNGILFITFHIDEKKIHVDNFFKTGKSLDFYYFDENKIIKIIKETGFEIIEALVRFPYKEEYPSKRAYIISIKK
jgi:ubiquinone/menaquinone biosynthesis C-methylase UbiE